MKKEHVMDEAQTNDLRSSIEETLKGSRSGKSGITWRQCAGNDYHTAKKLGPEKNRQTMALLAAITLN